MIWLLALLAIAPYLPALGGGFVFDDKGIIEENPAIHADSPRLALSTRYWPDSPHAGLYRPVTTFTYWVDTRVFGKSARAHHAVNIVLHALTTLLLFTCLRSWWPSRVGASWLAAAVFAVHPLHVEAVAGIVGRAEILAALCSLLALRLGLQAERAPRHRPMLLPATALAFGLAALSKESAIGIWAFAAYLAWIHPYVSRPGNQTGAASTWRLVLAAWTLALGFVFLLRLRVLGGIVALDSVSGVDNALVALSLPERVLNALGILWLPALQFFVPWRLSADYSFGAIVPGPAWMTGGAIFGLVILGAAALAWKHRALEILWGGALLVSTSLLTINLLFPIGTIYGERLTYLPLAAFAWILVSLGSRLAERRTGRSSRRIVLGVLLAWVVALGARSFVRCFDWESNLTLFRSATAVVPQSTKAWANYASALITNEEFEEAIEAARRSLEIQPEYTPAHRFLGSALNQSDRPEDAIAHLQRAARSGGRWKLEGNLDLGNAYLMLEKSAAAESTFAVARSLAKDGDARPWVGLASAYALQSRWSESRSAWHNAVVRDSTDLRFRSRWAYALWQAGRIDSAETIYREVLGDTGTAETKNDLAWFLIQEQRSQEEALRLAEDAFQETPGPNTGDTLLEAWLVFEGCGPARAWWSSLPSEQRQTLGDVLEKLEARCDESANDDGADSAEGK